MAWTLITALETTVQEKGDSRQPELPNSVSSLKEKVLSVITCQAEPLKLSWKRSPQPEKASEVQRGILTFGWNDGRGQNEHLVGTRTDRVMFFGKEGMISLNIVTTMRRNCEEVESVLDYRFTDLNM